jgi:hypothetical protein
MQVGQVRVEEARPCRPGAGAQVAGAGCGGVAAHGLAVHLQGTADLGDGQAAAQGGVNLAIAVPCLLSTLTFWRCRDARDARLGLGGFAAQAGAVPGGGSFDCVGEVVQQVPAVGDLDGERGAAGGALGVAAAAVAADHLDTGMGVQPGSEGVRGPPGKHVDRAPGLDVHQHGAVDVAAAQGEIIDAQHPRGGGRRLGQGAEQPQQRGPAGRAGQPAAQPGSGPAAQGQRDRAQRLAQAGGAPGVAAGQAGDLLGERGPGARVVLAEEPADLQMD